MKELAIIILSGTGTIFIVLAAIGIMRMPDFYLRLSVTVKATTLGVGMMLVSAAIFFGEVSTTSKSVSIIFFLILTAPVAAHMIGRASYFTGVPMWKKSVLDELKHKYDEKTSELRSTNVDTDDVNAPDDTNA
jgi:multicomponent Na+:H+ antiporter subunit G